MKELPEICRSLICIYYVSTGHLSVPVAYMCGFCLVNTSACLSLAPIVFKIHSSCGCVIAKVDISPHQLSVKMSGE